MLKKKQKRQWLSLPTPRPSLRFAPYAWGKLIYLRDRGGSEIGGFGLAAEDDPLLVVDILTVKQRCTSITVKFDDVAVADLFDEMVDQGVPPARFGRIWIHSHPGYCPLPSSTDEDTFQRVFGGSDWAVMAIVAQGGVSYARLSFHVGPGGALKIPVRVDYGRPFLGSDWSLWEQQYQEHVVVESFPAIDPKVAVPPETALDHDLPLFWDEEDFYQKTFTPNRFESQAELVPRERLLQEVITVS